MNSAEFNEKSILTTFFQDNAKAYMITLCSTLVELWYTLSILDVIEVNFLMGIITFLNITLLFTLFTAALKIKIYSKKWAINAIVIGVYAIIRAFIIIPVVVKPYAELSFNIILNVILGVLLISAGLMTIKVIKQRKPYLSKMENVNE
jgi:hypothetical protein